VFLIGCTNRYKALDEALLRPGRFDVVLELPYPTPAERLPILRHASKRSPTSITEAQWHRLGLLLDQVYNTRDDDTGGGVEIEERKLSGAKLQALWDSSARRAWRKGKAVVGYEEVREVIEEVLEGGGEGFKGTWKRGARGGGGMGKAQRGHEMFGLLFGDDQGSGVMEEEEEEEEEEEKEDGDRDRRQEDKSQGNRKKKPVSVQDGTATAVTMRRRTRRVLPDPPSPMDGPSTRPEDVLEMQKRTRAACAVALPFFALADEDGEDEVL